MALHVLEGNFGAALVADDYRLVARHRFGDVG